MGLFRLSSHPLVHWWTCIDRTSFVLVICLMAIGAAISVTASSAVASSYNVDSYYFASRQVMFLAVGLVLLVFSSLLSVRGVRNAGIFLFLVALVGIVSTIFIGSEIKGAQRWIDFAGFRVQPSELMKPSFVIVTAWLMSSEVGYERMRGFILSGVLLGIIASLLMMQPDFGMFVVISLVWFGQMFLANLAPTLLLGLMGLVFIGGGTGYVLLPHVRSRLMRFVDPESGDSYQVDRARQAFLDGGFFGRGPGEGVVKNTLPDAHTDFVFAVIGEEFGIIACGLILLIYGVILMRGFLNVFDAENKFVLLACSGLLLLFGAQIMINMGVALSLLPTTGMTLPFISYGGSSMVAVSIMMGFILALSRKRRHGSVTERRKY